MVWRIIFLLLIFCNNFLVNCLAPPGINPHIFEPSVKYQQEHRPVISKDGSSNIPRSPYEPPTAIFATRPPLPGYYKATKPFTRGPFPYVPVTESPIKIELKNPQDLLQELKNNGYYGEKEYNNKLMEKIVSNTGIFYPVQKTENGDMVGYVNVPYYEVPVTQSVKTQKVLILDDISTTSMMTTTTTTTTKKSTTTRVKSATITKKIDIPEKIKNEQSKLVTTTYLLSTQSTTESYPVVDISKHSNTPYIKMTSKIPEINKYNYPIINTNPNKYPGSISNNYGYEAIPISPEMYNSNYNIYSANYNNLQPSPQMTNEYYGFQRPVTKKTKNNLTPFFTRTKSHLATINPITEENINSIVSKIKDKKKQISYEIPVTSTIQPTQTTEYGIYQKPPSKVETQRPGSMIFSTKSPSIHLSTKGVEIKNGYLTGTPRKPIITQSTKKSSPVLIFTTTKSPILTFPTTTQKPLINTPFINKATPSIVIFEKSTKIVSLSHGTTDTSSVKFLSTTPSTKNVEQTVTFGETKKLDKEEIKSVKSNVKFNVEPSTLSTIQTGTPIVTFEKGSSATIGKIETEESAIFKDHTETTKHLKITTPKFSTIEIKPSIIEHETNESITAEEKKQIIKNKSPSGPSIMPPTISISIFSEKEKVISETSTLPARVETTTSETPINIVPSILAELPKDILSTLIPLEEFESTTIKSVQTSKVAATNDTEFSISSEAKSLTTSMPKTETTEVPFISEDKIFEKLTTEKSYVGPTTTEKITIKPLLESSTIKEKYFEPKTTEESISETSTMENIKPTSNVISLENEGIITSTEPSIEHEKITTLQIVQSNTAETSTLSIPQQHSESLFPEHEGTHEVDVGSIKTTESLQSSEKMTTKYIKYTTKEPFETIELTSIPTTIIESTITPTEMFQTTTLFSEEAKETNSFLSNEFETTSQISTQKEQESEASTYAFTTVKPEMAFTQSTEEEVVPFSPTNGLFTLNELTESTTLQKIIVDFDSAKVTKNITELCATEQPILKNDTVKPITTNVETQSTEFTFPSIKLSEEKTTLPVELLFPTFLEDKETLTTQNPYTVSKYFNESTKILESTTIKQMTIQETENTTHMTKIFEKQTTLKPEILQTLGSEISTVEKLTTEEEVFPTEFPLEETTTQINLQTVPFFFSNMATTEESTIKSSTTLSTKAFETTHFPHTLTFEATTTEELVSETTTKLIKSVVIIDGKKKLPVLKVPELPGVEFISPNMTITKILDKSTNKFVSNSENATKSNFVSVQVTTDVEKPVELADVDFEKILEKELDELIPKILETLNKEGKELGENLEKSIVKELEKEIKNKDDVGGKNTEDLLKNNSEKGFFDRDYPDFNPPKDKVFDSNMFRNDDTTIRPCPYEPFISSEPPTDIMFVIDGTKSMSVENFMRSLKMMGDFVMKFDNIGPNGTQFSLVQYTTQPFFEFSFKKHFCRDDILKDIIETSYMKGNNNTNNLDIALDKVNKFGFSYLRGDRPEAKNFLIIFSGNGQKNDNIGSAIEELKNNNVEVFAICEDGENHNIFNDFLPQNNIMPLENDSNVVDMITNNIKKIGSKNINYDDINMIKIDCKDNELRVVLEVPKSYQGIFATKNYSDNTTCSRKVPMEIGDGYKQLGFTFKNNDCGLNIFKNNQLNGKNYSIVMNILKDDKEISENDKSYLVQCFVPNKNAEGNENKTFSDNIPIDIVPPICQYSLHRDSIDGPIVNLAVIGQTIYHKWECHGVENIENYYGMFIHNCFIGTHGKKKMLKMIDDNGCNTRNTTVDNIIYNNHKMIAYAKSQVFSLEDVEHMKFSCKIGLCLKKNGDCDGITPPQCNKNNDDETSAVIRHDRQINPMNQALENDVEITLQIIKSFRFGAQKFVSNNDAFNYKDLDGPVVPIMLIILIISLSIFIMITVYKKYKRPLFKDDDNFSNSYNSNISKNSCINNNIKFNLEDVNLEDKKLYHVNYNLINFYKNASVEA